ncbi:MAG TPA: peptidylprolyl isomerase [Caldimonas sp.]|jgi:peptidyl-prolyl cis-trans isomerase SurA|nr:peptidylprolyl isomerase [Caldimonas sp.]HEV7575323.1 peptidylprolyl isomerase [Caldimonas sp.]
MTDLKLLCRRAVVAGALCFAAAHIAGQTGDYIVAVVNQELVTASEVQQRLARVRDEAGRNRTPLPPAPALRKQVLDTLIDERVLVTNARESGARIDDPELDRAVANVATQNQLTPPQLRERLRQEGIPYNKFRDNIRDQLLVERVREREVVSRIKVSDVEIDEMIEKRRTAAGTGAQINVAQILVAVAEGASDGIVAERRGRAEAALKRVRAGEDFAAVAREVSEDSNRSQGGEIGLRALDRLPDLFVRAAQRLQPGEVAPELVRSGAGFHVLKLVDRKESPPFTVDQSRARHILLRPSPELTPEAAARRLVQFKRDILSGARTFEQLARDNSEDGSAAQGGDLGWSAPGSFVPEFEEAMVALPVGGISDPVSTRFGLHLIQVVDRRQTTLDNRQLREQARNILKEQKFEPAFAEWLRDLRGRAYIEYREPPQ